MNNPKQIAKLYNLSFSLPEIDNHRLAILCGQQDANLHQIEAFFSAQIMHRGGSFRIRADKNSNHCVQKVIETLYHSIKPETPLPAKSVQETILRVQDQFRGKQAVAEQSNQAEVVIRLQDRIIRGLNTRQLRYLQNMEQFDINFCIGPAGTGKTYLAVATAAQALVQHKVERIVLVRPAVEAGERLGFLPGDIGQKVDPYLRPLYDALYDMLGFDQVGKLLQRGIIELAPLAYMRGRTLNDAFIILDEAQNSTSDQLKMFLTRIGFSTKAVVTGDITQTDLPQGQSGLKIAQKILADVEGLSFTTFTVDDVVRHPLTQRIICAYEHHEAGKT